MQMQEQPADMIGSAKQSPTVAIVLNRDLLFGSRIRSALVAVGLEGRFVPDSEGFVRALEELQDSAAIGIVDMNGPVAWAVLRATLAEGDDALPPTLAFGPHVDAEGRRAAKAAGITRLVSNGQFHSDMPGLIDRYRRR
ncbi:MAG TPA: hypothetical protein VK356_04665 [Thermomicrobiales bacterium]|nr:hypothetical protein [Thermomicrobiales bacterium]